MVISRSNSLINLGKSYVEIFLLKPTNCNNLSPEVLTGVYVYTPYLDGDHSTSNIARKIYEDILEYGNVQKALLGVSGIGLNARIAEELGIEETEGFHVAGVDASMGAALAGIKESDVIIRVDEAEINSFADLTGYLGSKRPGETVGVRFLRDGKEQLVSVKLMRTPYVNYYGMRLRNLSEEEAKEFGLKQGVKVSAIENRRLYSRGVSDGDVLLSINGNELKNVDDVDALDEDYIYEVEFLNKDKEKMRFIFE